VTAAADVWVTLEVMFAIWLVLVAAEGCAIANLPVVWYASNALVASDD